jgi:hypothetical protein
MPKRYFVSQPHNSKKLRSPELAYKCHNSSNLCERQSSVTFLDNAIFRPFEEEQTWLVEQRAREESGWDGVDRPEALQEVTTLSQVIQTDEGKIRFIWVKWFAAPRRRR